MYKLTIIIINYNNLDGLKRTIESVVNQTYEEFKYIGSFCGEIYIIDN